VERSLGRPKRRWKDKIRIYVKVDCKGFEWIELAQGVSCEHSNEPPASIKCGESLRNY
jgi:hypothetical protein